MTSDPIRAAVEQRRVTIALARARQTEIVITPDEAEAAVNLMEALDRLWDSDLVHPAVGDCLSTARALAEAITHRSGT